MITLYTALSLWGLASISPVCMELETWLRMAKLPYNAIVVTADNLKLAPKGKVPNGTKKSQNACQIKITVFNQ
ncbi:hypothetical protein [Nostoc sp. 'Lobaria pulmonaria (5183) cyanobiont']|uniref:hypothetical protein n=1 Tax=Nostoc sp. 'Lobaria pulmonaria (5183) cyanobiont' TaxID=1618022 RepID=UPI000CF319CA|nr:hypothetical protein [Nostoc sp. 'Lobaria pulmonaria (5183) cyanobiont']